MTSLPPPRRSSTRLLALIALIVTVAVSAGCAPSPAPSPTPTAAFASQEEAFAAAEQTFAEYTKASNDTDLSDPETFEPVFAWLVGDALSAARKNYSRFHAERITRTGVSSFDTVTRIRASQDDVTLRLCLDVSKVGLVTSEGLSAVPADRPPRQALEVLLVPADTRTHLAIASTIPTEALQCA